MQIKRFDRRGQWGLDNAKRYFHREFANDDFTGVMALLYFDDVIKPCTWNYADKPVRVCDKGMKWLQFIPSNKNYAVKAMIDEDDTINLWYIDIIADYGYTDDNVIYIEDLYVDIILYPDGGYIIDTVNEELNEALFENEITQDMYNYALKTKSELLSGLVSDPDALARFCTKYLKEMNSILNV